MDGGAGILATITRWSTPTILFCMLNLMVVTIFIRSRLKTKKNIQEQLITPLICEENDAVHFFRFPSLLTRVKSINFSRRKDPEEEEKEEEEELVEEEEEELVGDDGEEEKVEEERHVARTISDTIVETVVKRQVMRGVKMMKKSQSAKIVRVEEVEEVERQRPATVRERKGNMNGTVPFGEDEAVDDKADDFINRFRQQLKLQRLESFLKYRGASK
ncbi:hypothetical protein Leryth_008770 [Lithospermum erythrorhizon]|nr:hypothetical protein Leryth_008770 [Lithospermum erythrorhizon]